MKDLNSITIKELETLVAEKYAEMTALDLKTWKLLREGKIEESEAVEKEVDRLLVEYTELFYQWKAQSKET